MIKKPKPIAHIKHYRNYYLIIIGILLILFIVSSWLFVRNYKPILSDRLKKQIYYATDSLYRVSFSKVHLNPVLGSFTLDSFHLIPDTATYNRLKLQNRAPNDLFDIYIDHFQLRKIHFWSLVKEKKVNIGVIKVENPQITIFHDSEENSGNTDAIRESLFRLTSGPLKIIQIDHIGLHNIIFKYKDVLKNESGKMKLDNMDLIIGDLRIDSSALKDSSRFLFAKSVWFHLEQSKFYVADSLYEISTKGISFSVNEGKIAVQKLKVIPQKTRSEFDKGLFYRKNLLKASVDSLSLEGVDVSHLIDNKWLASRLQLHHFNLEVYLNAEKPVKPVVKPLVRDALMDVSNKIAIDSILLTHGNITYVEKNPVSHQTGYVSFNNVHGDICNVTNDSSRLKNNPVCSADLHALFMGKGALHALFTFDLTDENNTFTYRGHLSDLNATTLNVASRPLGLVRIKSGKIHSLDYNFHAENSGAYGDVNLKYDRLGISVLSKNQQTGDLKKKGLISLAANLLVIKNNNISDSLAKQQTHVQYPRDKYRSIFNLMWKSIFQGTKVIVGVDKQTENKLKSLKSKGNKIKHDVEEGKKSIKGVLKKVGGLFEKKKEEPEKEK